MRAPLLLALLIPVRAFGMHPNEMPRPENAVVTIAPGAAVRPDCVRMSTDSVLCDGVLYFKEDGASVQSRGVPPKRQGAMQELNGAESDVQSLPAP